MDTMHATPALPAGPFDVIYADPPWRYEGATITPNRRIENHYPTMDLEAICALPVRDIAAKDAVLYLWAPAAKLAEAMEVIDAWGFTFRTHAVWVKPSIGPGHWVRAQHEDLLIARRGKMRTPAPATRPSSVFEAPRKRHSAKPEIVYVDLERMYPDARRIELFARQHRPGWRAWGNEVTTE